MKNFRFTLYLNGLGENAEEGWNDAVDSILQDPDQLNEMPEEYSEVDEEE